MKIGLLNLWGKEFTFETNGSEVTGSDDALKSFSFALADPWDIPTYEITENRKDTFTEVPEGEPNYVCEYYARGLDCLETFVWGYGKDEETALADCIMNKNMFIERE